MVRSNIGQTSLQFITRPQAGLSQKASGGGNQAWHSGQSY